MDRDSFWLVCNDSKQKCHCDWRVTIVDCIERQPMLYMYIVNAIWSLLICIIGSGLLYHRVVNKKLPIFDINPPNGFLIRPKPIESMLFFGLIFNVFLYELPWQFGICAFACYLCGIAHTVSSSSKIFGTISVKTDALCFIVIALPFLTNNVCSVAAAVYANKGDMIKAKIFTDSLYYLWTIYCFNLACCILFSGLKLISLLEKHLKNQKDDNSTNVLLQKVKNGLYKVRVIMAISIVSLFIFSFIKCAYGATRTSLLQNRALNLAVAAVWTYDGTLASMLVVMTVIFNPKALSFFSLSSSSHNNSSPYYQIGARSNFLVHNRTDSHIVDNDDSTFTLMAKSGVELKEYNFSSDNHDKYDKETIRNVSYAYCYDHGQSISGDNITSKTNHFISLQSSASNIHTVLPSH